MRNVKVFALMGVIAVTAAGCGQKQEAAPRMIRLLRQKLLRWQKQGRKQKDEETEKPQWEPQSAISVVLPASPGGTVDLSARLWAQYVKEVCGWNAVVVNSAGASGSCCSKYRVKF